MLPKDEEVRSEMFSDSTIRDVSVSDRAAFVAALVSKLTDLDKNRIHANDSLVLRKAVFGLLEIVAELEQRLIALEGPDARSSWAGRLEAGLDARSPDQVRLGE
jgi:hypothetical protein